ncbi:hypothetical protein KP509_05G102200 [Ceratopteris richardii]|uniref:V-type proton ATPase proteolipid subunit n=1 Tax=Ceratopteris richardii TaxID=49495 RepID=A0A8T2UVW3_CERRI|nr:hypothetical protein KP509_05G102200 [Ceratopteris richardii]
MSTTEFNGDTTASFFGFLGTAAALVFFCMGVAYGTAKSDVCMAFIGAMRPELMMKSLKPVVMAGVLGVRANAEQPKFFVGVILIFIFAEALALYGFIVGIILSSRAGQSRE